MNDAPETNLATGFARTRVPVSEQGSGWRIFFVVAGSLCGLPVFILGAQISGGLGFARGAWAVLIGTTILAGLGGLSAYAGSRTRMGVAMLADAAFGPLGARLVKLVLALSLIGWFGVDLSVLGASASHALQVMAGLRIPALAIALPFTVAIAGVAIAGVAGLERLGMILVPLVAVILSVSFALTIGRLGAVAAAGGSGALTSGGAVSAIVGSFVVGVLV